MHAGVTYAIGESDRRRVRLEMAASQRRTLGNRLEARWFRRTSLRLHARSTPPAVGGGDQVDRRNAWRFAPDPITGGRESTVASRADDRQSAQHRITLRGEVRDRWSSGGQIEAQSRHVEPPDGHGLRFRQPLGELRRDAVVGGQVEGRPPIWIALASADGNLDDGFGVQPEASWLVAASGRAVGRSDRGNSATRLTPCACSSLA